MPDAEKAPGAPPRVLEFLDAHSSLTLATASPMGTPRATTLRYVNDGLRLYLWVRSQSWTARQIEQNPLVSFTINDESAGLQGSGEARPVLSGDETALVVKLFADKFPMALGASTMNIAFIRIAPIDVKLVDETYGGGRGETQMFAGAEYQVDHVYNVVRELPVGDVGAILGRLHRVEVADGELVARQGTPADKFMIVLEGELEVVRENDSGDSGDVGTLGPGDFFGEVAILIDSPRSASLRAKGPTTVLTMDREDFRAVVAQSLGLSADFDRVVQERLGGGGGP
jgi:uncharacterized protein YhbP (UPF0306 family)